MPIVTRSGCWLHVAIVELAIALHVDTVRGRVATTWRGALLWERPIGRA